MEDRELIQKIFSKNVFFTHHTEKIDEFILIPKEYLEDKLKKYRTVWLEPRLCRKLMDKEKRCIIFKQNCKKCILSYWKKGNMVGK